VSMTDNQNLTELIEPGKYCICDYRIYGRPLRICAYCEKPIAPDYDTDLNAMREVWKVLKEQELWDDFQTEYISLHNLWDLYDFLNDPLGQMKAAIKVLREAQGGE